MKHIEQTTSLSSLDFLFFRAVKEGNADPVSLETMGLDYLLSYLEYLDIQNYLEKDIHNQIEKRK